MSLITDCGRRDFSYGTVNKTTLLSTVDTYVTPGFEENFNIK
jgi:hypothetical protein